MGRIQDFLSRQGPHHVVTGNTLMVLEAQRDRALRQILEDAALVVPESSGIFWASRRYGQPLSDYLPGIDLFMALCQRASECGHSVYLLGAKPGVAERAASTLQARFPALRIGGTHHGYIDEASLPMVLANIRQAQPAILFVAMNVPGQEKWIAKHLPSLAAKVVMGVGGSFDVISGQLRRAPLWMRRGGLEWCYRFWQEPWRWRRMIQLPRFVVHVLYDAARFS